jgi:hypothetical protein
MRRLRNNVIRCFSVLSRNYRQWGSSGIERQPKVERSKVELGSWDVKISNWLYWRRLWRDCYEYSGSVVMDFVGQVEYLYEVVAECPTLIGQVLV